MCDWDGAVVCLTNTCLHSKHIRKQCIHSFQSEVMHPSGMECWGCGRQWWGSESVCTLLLVNIHMQLFWTRGWPLWGHRAARPAMKNETQQPLMKTHVQSISACVSGAWALPIFFFSSFEQWFMYLCLCVSMRECETERKSKRKCVLHCCKC